MSVGQVAEWAAGAVEVTGIAVIVAGSAQALIRYLLDVARPATRARSYAATRRRIGRAILLGLEVLVAGDIIATVAVEPTLNSVAVLAGIVAIRTFLSWSIELETDGRWPWQQREEAPT